MAGTENGVAADDDALFVLTAVLLTPAQFPSVLGDDYPAACAALGIEPYAEGYGLVLGQDGDGARWTVVVDDVSSVAVAIAAWDCGMEYDLSPDERSMVCALPGWPLAVAVSTPGVAAPHDPLPDPSAEGAGPAPLEPPDTSVWGPAQRRMGADEVALRWAAWREQVDAGPTTAGTGGSREEPGAGGSRTDQDAGDAGLDEGGAGRPGGHPGVGRALDEARAYVDSPPPPGRVRSSFAAGEARMLRADGPGWSLTARTDDMAFVLLDDEPGEVLPVHRGPELPALLRALDALAVRPS